jgi:hypothetical protein
LEFLFYFIDSKPIATNKKMHLIGTGQNCVFHRPKILRYFEASYQKKVAREKVARAIKLRVNPRIQPSVPF